MVKKDGKGGPGNVLAPVNPIPGAPSAMIPGASAPMPSPAPMSPGMGISTNADSLTPQQSMQMAAQGMMPMGSAPKAAPTRPPKLSNKPHKSPKGSGAHKLKGMKKASLKSTLAKLKVTRKPVF